MTESEGQPQGLELRVSAGADADPEELERLTAALERELADVDAVERVSRPAGGPPPPGARAIDVLAIGTLLVTLGRRAGGLRAVTRAVKGWLAAQGSNSVELTIGGDTIVVKNVSDENEDRLVTAFIERHGRE